MSPSWSVGTALFVTFSTAISPEAEQTATLASYTARYFMMTNKRAPQLLLYLIGGFLLSLAQTAAATEDAPKWSSQGLVYILAPTLSGTQGLGGL